MARLMGTSRRNTITRNNATAIYAISIASGVLAALADAHPTGGQPADAVLCFAVGAVVTWLGASAPWWALASSAGVITAASSQSSVVVTIAGSAAVLASLWIGYLKASRSVERSVITAAIVFAGLRLSLHDFFLESAIVALLGMGLVAVTGWMRRQRYIRIRVIWGVAGFALIMLLGGAGMAAGGLRAKSNANAGYHHLLDGLDRLDGADMSGASSVLAEAAGELRKASDDLDGALTQAAKIVPGLAQNRAASARLMGAAADAALAASNALAVIDLDQLTVVNGRIDVEALAVLASPLSELATTVDKLSAVLHDVDSPWLIGPLDTRLDTARRRVDKVDRQAAQVSATAITAPGMLGADGTRRYLLAFTNPAEARGVSGLMGNWSEVTISDGKIDVTANGRSAQLIQDLRDHGVVLDMPDDFFARYGGYGAGSKTTDVNPKFWSNSTMSPDMPSVGSVMAQMYEAGTGRKLDGVFVIDPAGIAALLGATGNSITVPNLDQTLTASTVEQFLLLGQYKFAENDREDLLAAVTEQTVDQILHSTLPKPQQLIEQLGPAALGGHVSIWAARDDEESFLREVGVDNALPGFTGPYGSADGLAVVTNNASGNKIESFLQRTVEYTPVYDAGSGETSGTLTITLTNNAPTTGYPDYVIGNIVGVPTGTNRMLLSVYSRLGASAATVDGQPVTVETGGELGWNVYSKFVDVPSGKTVVVTMTLSGRVARGQYQLIYRPQALPNDDAVKLHATTSSGRTIFAVDGTIDRRSVLSSSGETAWRE